MAYFQPLKKDDDDEQGAPGAARSGLISGASTEVAGGGAGGAPVTGLSGAQQTATPGGTRSGRWVNIQDYLNANAWRPGLQVGSMGNRLGSEEMQRYGKESEAARNFQVRPEDTSQESIKKRLQSGDLTGLRSALNPGEAPRDVAFDINRDNDALINKISNRNTVMDVLAKDAITKGNYGLGLRSLDEALLSADKNYQEGADIAKSRWENVRNFIGGDIGDVNRALQRSRETAVANKEGVLKSLGDIESGVLGNLRKQSEQLNQGLAQQKASQQEKFQNWLNNVYLPAMKAESKAAGKTAYTGNARSLLPDWSFIKPGEEASLESVVSPEDLKLLEGIESLQGRDIIGMPSRARATTELGNPWKDAELKAEEEWWQRREGPGGTTKSGVMPSSGFIYSKEMKDAVDRLIGAAREGREFASPEELYDFLQTGNVSGRADYTVPPSSYVNPLPTGNANGRKDYTVPPSSYVNPLPPPTGVPYSPPPATRRRESEEEQPKRTQKQRRLLME